METAIQGPGIFLAQFVRDEHPFDSIEGLAGWVSSLGYRGLQVPAWDPRCIHLDQAATSRTYCDEYCGRLAEKELVVSELGAFLAGQVLAFHAAYETMFAGFFPEGLDDTGRIQWATAELEKSLHACVGLGTSVMPVLSGGLAWPFMYPWPQRPAGFVDEAFKELARRWMPILDLARDLGISVAFELHPGSDIYDGATFERFLDATNNHPAVAINYDASHFLLQQLDYLDFIRLYGDRIAGFHVKDAEFRPGGRMGVYGGYADWSERAGRFRSLGDGQVDFTSVFTLLTEAGYRGWATLEWECAVKSPEQGAREGAGFIRRHIIETSDLAFDDFVGSRGDVERNRRILGIS
jgi:sugar phosphate isomerase/epimerase